MNRLTELLTHKREGLRSVFFTAGFPQLADTVPIALGLDGIGIDLIEIGMPFSDPVADGPVIQKSSMDAISNGMNLNILFDQVKQIRVVSQIPIVLMGYLNPIFNYGVDQFLKDAVESGVDGLILPDLPPELFEYEYKILFEAYNISWIPLITQQTSTDRIQWLDGQCTGFLYAVSTSGVTGARGSFSEESVEFFKKLKSMELCHPVLVGFGVSSSVTINQVQEHLAGVIIGSAFVKLLQQHTDINEAINAFSESVLNIPTSLNH